MSPYRKHLQYESLTSRWGGMKLRYDLGPRIEMWLSNFPELERPLLLDLLSKFYYYSEERIKEKVKELYASFKLSYAEDAANAVYTRIYKELGVAYSNIVFTSFWLENKLSDSAEENVFDLLRNDVVPSTLVIVDDYSGTGKTFIKTVNKYIELNHKIAECSMYFLVLHITKIAKEQIRDYAKATGISIQVISMDESEETFKKGYLYDEVNAVKNRLGYSEVYTRLHATEEYAFGFESVESLVAFHYNTPNNTLGLFWQDLMNFCALFPRHKKGETTLRQMQKEAQNRKRRRANIVAFGLADKRNAAFAAYCISKGARFSQEEAITDFGFTPDQINSLLKEMLNSEYLTYQDGRFCATAKLKSNLFTSRLKELKKSYESEGTDSISTFCSHEEYIPINFK